MTLAELLEKDLTGITFEDIQSFCSLKLPEGVQLDYKSIVNDKITKQFAAFSNHRGGIIIFGVVEDKKSGTPKEFNGIEIDGQNIESLHQMATHIDPRPLYDVFPTTEKEGRRFIVLRIYEGEAPPYYVKNEGNIYVRSGNITDDISIASPEQIKSIFAKRDKALATQLVNRKFAEEIYKSHLIQQERERERLIKAGTQNVTDAKVGENVIVTNFNIQPWYASQALIENWKLREVIMQEHIRTSSVSCFPDVSLLYSPIPLGISGFRWSQYDGSVENIVMFANGYFASIADVLRVEKEDRRVSASNTCANAIRGLRFSKNFYQQIGYNGKLVIEILILGAQGSSVRGIVSHGWGDERQKALLDDYRITMETSTNVLNDEKMLVDLECKIIEEIHWQLGQNTYQAKSLVEDLRTQI